jgi:predicted ATPase
MERQIFIARERELRQLDEFLNRASAGQGQVCFVIGEAGCGKTALVTEFARQTEEVHNDLIVAIGNCNAQSGIGDPYLPFREVLCLLTGDVNTKLTRGAITQKNADRLRNFLRVSAEALVELGPDLIDTFVPGTKLATRAATFVADKSGWLEKLEKLKVRKTPDIVDNAQEQSHIFEQYTDVLQALATKKLIMLVVDDLQWADVSSISLLFHLGRRIEGGRILVIGTYRPEDVALGRGGEQHPLEGVVSEFKRYYGDIWVDLDRAEEAEGRRFVAAFLDTEPNLLNEDFRQTLFQHTEGHPLFTIELLREMQERSDLVQDEQSRWIEDPTLDWSALPARVEGVIEKRIERLEERLRETLAVASVEGEDFTAQVVAKVREFRERQLLRDLSRELEKRHRLIKEREEVTVDRRRLSRYQFAHTLFQQYLYNELSVGERRLLHGEVAGVLEELYKDQTDEIAVQLAHHYSEAGEEEKAVAYKIKAGEKAAGVFAWEEARQHFETTLELLEEENLKQRAEIVDKLGVITSVIGDNDSSVRYKKSAIELYETLGDKSNIIRSHMALQTLYTGGAWDGAMEYKALEHLKQVAVMIEDDPDSTEKGRIYERAAHIYLHYGEPAKSLEWNQKVVDLFNKLGISRITQLGTALTYTGRIDEGITYSEGIWESVLKLSNLLITAIVGHQLSLMLVLARNIPRARMWGERVLPEVIKAGSFFEGFLRRPLALAYALSGEVLKAEESCQVEEEIEKKTLLGCFFEDACSLGFHHLRRGDWEKARAYLDQAITTHQGRKNLAAVSACSFTLATLNMEEGNYETAEKLLLKSLEICRKGGNILFELWVLPVLCELYLKIGQHDKAAEDVKRGFNLLKPDLNWYGLPAPMYLAKGMLASEKRNWDEAIKCYAEAVGINRQYELPWDEAKSLYEWGLMYINRGTKEDREAAIEKLDTALAIFQRIDAKRDIEKVIAEKMTLIG